MDEKLTHWKKLHNPDYLGAYALNPGEELIATIQSAGVESVMGASGKKEDCMVVRFVERDIKPLICNVTNSKAISKVACSPYVEKWSGVKIQLFVATVSAFGEEVEAIRVRPRAPKTTLPEMTVLHPKFEETVAKILSKKTTLETVRKFFLLSDETVEVIMARIESTNA
jgi:hypothetical protein